MEIGKLCTDPAALAALMGHLPQTPPMRQLDRVLEVVPGERITAIRVVSAADPLVDSHMGILSATLMAEAVAQAGLLLAIAERPEFATRSIRGTGMDEIRARREVTPGDVLQIEVKKIRHREGRVETWVFRGQVTVDGQPALTVKRFTGTVLPVSTDAS